MTGLQGKKILFFAPRFFDYENAIKKEMETQGATVHLYDERNNPSSIKKILLRKARWVLSKSVFQYYKSICQKELLFSPDYVFFVNPEAVTKKSLLYIKECFPSAKMILYMWDSLKNKHVRKLLPAFDKILSFDKQDCEKYGIKFRPLFFIPQFEWKDDAVASSFVYDFGFIGTAHSDRAKILYKIKEICDREKYSYFFYLYVPGILLYRLRFFLDKYLRKMEKFVHLTPMDKDEIDNIYKETRYVVDMNHPKQSGLTMRTIEMVGMKRKFLTTNKYIQEYDFYCSQNQLILDRNKIDLPNIRNLSYNYEDIDDNIYYKYTLKSFVLDVFAEI